KFELLVEQLLEAAGKDMPLNPLRGKDGNVEKLKPINRWEYNRGTKGLKGSMRDPEAVKETSSLISKAIEKLSPEDEKRFKSSLTEYMTLYVRMDSEIRQLQRLAEDLARMRQNLERAVADKNFKRIDIIKQKLTKLKAEYFAREVELEQTIKTMDDERPSILDYVKEMLVKVEPSAGAALERYNNLVLGRREEANKGQGHQYLYNDIIKSLAEFYKNIKHHGEVKHTKTLSKHNIPDEFKNLIKLIQKADPSDKEAALELVKQIPTEKANIFKRTLLNVDIKKYYDALNAGDQPQQAELVRSIYNIAGQSA
ncbi:hypothetical protein EBU95_19410, partial [bacterium]|nr:hypothetical protein [bacterium]